MNIDCVHCKTALGDAPKRAPVHADDGGAGREAWCPPCFVHVRAPLEPNRYAHDRLMALSCVSCGWESLAVGVARCAQCRSTLTIALGMPKSIVLAPTGTS